MNITFSKNVLATVAIIAAAFLAPLPAANSAAKQLPDINPADFVAVIDNPFFPCVPGTTKIFTSQTPDGVALIQFAVTHETKVILGVTTTTVCEIESLDGVVDEISTNWFAQDTTGNVWYFGEAAKQYLDGEVVGADGSWEGGVNGAAPGYLMLANPHVGDSYQQEVAPGIAEDSADVVSLSEIASVPYGTYNNCLKTREYSPLEPGVDTFKYYAAGIGLLREEGDGASIDLIDIIPPVRSGATIAANMAQFQAGDSFILSATLTNGATEQKTLDEYVVLDYAGVFFFAPSWSSASDHAPVTLNAGQSLDQELLNFTWPQGAGQADGVVFWAFLIDPATESLFGHHGHCEFSFR